MKRSDVTQEKGLVEKMVERITDLVVSVDRPAVIAHVRALRERYPQKDNRTIAKGLISRARWKATLLGAGSGVLSNPLAAAPAVAIDLAALWRIEVNLAARIAVLYDPHFFDDPEPPYELLVPLFGTRLISGLGGQVATRGAMVTSRLAIRRYLRLQTLRNVQRILLRYLGVKATQKAIITKTVPVVGSLVGGGWNFGEVSLVGMRVVAYFEQGGVQIVTGGAECMAI